MYVVGRSYGYISFDGVDGALIVPGSDSADEFFLAKLRSPDLKTVWAKQYAYDFSTNRILPRLSVGKGGAAYLSG